MRNVEKREELLRAALAAFPREKKFLYDRAETRQRVSRERERERDLLIAGMIQ